MNEPTIILVVEDEPLSQDVIVRRLQARGFETAVVGNGVECIDWLTHHRADLVLMDVAMPRMNGLDATRLLRKSWSHDSLPIIVVSASVDSEDVVAGLEAGANDYVIKPVNFPVLMARIHACLRMKRSVTLLVEAERQRVMIESLGRSVAKLSEPMTQIVNELEQLTHDADPQRRLQLERVLDWVEQAVDVIDQIRHAGQASNVPYLERIERLDGSDFGSAPVDTMPSDPSN
jgi:DNA-binding response OmpR family regulator